MTGLEFIKARGEKEYNDFLWWVDGMGTLAPLSLDEWASAYVQIKWPDAKKEKKKE